MEDRIEDEQDLLERYYRSECGVISERSSSIRRDTMELFKVVMEYAQRRGIDIYIEPPEYY